MTSKLTRERIELIANFHRAMTLPPSHAEIEELARMALAALDSEPVAWTDEQELRDVDRGGCGYLFTVNPVTPHADERRIILLYRHAQPVVEIEPMAEVLSNRPGNDTSTIDRALPVGTQLYRHAQPAPVVPKSISVRQAISALESAGEVTTIGQAYKMGWNACRAAMLNGGKS